MKHLGRGSRTSLAGRLAGLFALGAGLVLIGLGLFLDHAVTRHFEETDRSDLLTRAQIVVTFLQHQPIPAQRPLQDLPGNILQEVLPGHPPLGVQIRRSQEPLWETRSPDFPGELPPWAPTAEEATAPSPPSAPLSDPHASHFGNPGTPLPALVTTQVGGHPLRILTLNTRSLAGASPSGEDPPVNLRLVMAIDHHEEFLHAFRESMLLGGCLGALGVGALAWLAAWRGLRPLRTLTRLAQTVSAEALGSAHLEPGPLPGDLQPLAIAWNEMLTRLEEAFRRLHEFSSDIAHELRTPITNLMIQTQVMLDPHQSPRPEAAYQEVLLSALEEYERLSRMINELLFLARADNGLLARADGEVDLRREADALVEFYEALAESLGVTVSVTGSASLRGDSAMLRRALGNLLANALRHSPAGETVGIDIRLHPSEAPREIRVAVKNPGEIIPPEHLPHLFHRFYRVASSRTRQDGGGSGLGLAIAQAIAQAHGGHIEVSSTPEEPQSKNGNTCFTLVLPWGETR